MVRLRTRQIWQVGTCGPRVPTQLDGDGLVGKRRAPAARRRCSSRHGAAVLDAHAAVRAHPPLLELRGGGAGLSNAARGGHSHPGETANRSDPIYMTKTNPSSFVNHPHMPRHVARVGWRPHARVT